MTVSVAEGSTEPRARLKPTNDGRCPASHDIDLCFELHWGVFTKYLLNEYVYYSINIVGGIMLAHVTLTTDIAYQFMSCVAGYCLMNADFAILHFYLHAKFIECGPDRFKMQPFELLSYYHHYEPLAQRIFSDNWLAWRMCGFPDGLVGAPVAWCAPLLCFGFKKTYPLIVWWMFWWMIQATIHEWYHVNPKMRPARFSFLFNQMLSLWDRCGFLDSSEHLLRHHGHDQPLADVEDFFDVGTPFLRFTGISRVIDWTWKESMRFQKYGAGVVTKGVVVARSVFIPVIHLVGMTFLQLWFDSDKRHFVEDFVAQFVGFRTPGGLVYHASLCCLFGVCFVAAFCCILFPSLLLASYLWHPNSQKQK